MSLRWPSTVSLGPINDAGPATAIASAAVGLRDQFALLGEARIYRPQLAARFVLNRCGARTILARETAETLADHDPPLLSTTIGQRIVFADVVQTGRLAAEQELPRKFLEAILADLRRAALAVVLVLAGLVSAGTAHAATPPCACHALSTSVCASVPRFS